MCGIIGYVGCHANSNSVLIEGLQALEYRGYDSAGIASVIENTIQIIKAKGKVSSLANKMQHLGLPNATVGIAHTRWATHGEPNESNCHPHQSGGVTLVHNGIIENYMDIKINLKQQDIAFYSDTDSEVACAYIAWCYKKYKNKQKALCKAYEHLKGSFAFAILFADEPTTLYAMRKNSPLVLGIGEDAVYISSDISAFVSYTRNYLLLEHEEIARCTKDGIIIENLKNEVLHKEVQTTDLTMTDIKKDGYAHYMLKEIHEEPAAVKQTIEAYLHEGLQDLASSMPSLKKYEELHIVACGSAMYAGMVAKSLIEKKARIPVECSVASEYRYREPIYDRKTFVIVISQSGETADTIAALQLAKEKDIDTLAIVNVVGSSIARIADHVLYTFAGPEISVATTKAYCTQVALLSLIAVALAYEHELLKPQEIEQFLQEIKQLPTYMNQLITSTQYRKAATYLYEHNDVYFLGRGLDYALCLEGSLKLKEISYIHSEAYPAGELKHGTISLIEQGTPIIALVTNEDIYEKTLSNIKEVKARGAKIILLTTNDLAIAKDYYDDTIILPKTSIFLQGILAVIPLQLIAYETAKLRGCEIDQPRNLAKSVTVE